MQSCFSKTAVLIFREIVDLPPVSALLLLVCDVNDANKDQAAGYHNSHDDADFPADSTRAYRWFSETLAIAFSTTRLDCHSVLYH